jgi:hypothetical protein
MTIGDSSNPEQATVKRLAFFNKFSSGTYVHDIDLFFSFMVICWRQSGSSNEREIYCLANVGIESLNGY